MPFIRDETEETKNRIIDAAKRHFSDKGFDATRVDELARDAGVNKALIYYYFKSKEAILDHLIQRFFDDVSAIAMDFVENNIVSMIKRGQLDIQQDRWCFTSEEDASIFYNAIIDYYGKIVDFMLLHRRIVRILMFESLKNGKHHHALFHTLDMINSRDKGSFYQTIWNADQDFAYTADIIVFKFFFGFTPMLNFAAYFEDYLALSGMSEAELRASFLHAYQKMASVFMDGKDILL